MDVMQFYTDESLAVHATCDKYFVPREADGEKLSMSQRVRLLGLAYGSVIETQVAIARARGDGTLKVAGGG